MKCALVVYHALTVIFDQLLVVEPVFIVWKLVLPFVEAA